MGRDFEETSKHNVDRKKYGTNHDKIFKKTTATSRKVLTDTEKLAKIKEIFTAMQKSPSRTALSMNTVKLHTFIRTQVM